jgi:hypothetical protein
VPQLVRAGLRYNRWLETVGLAPFAFPADVITDLRTAGDRVSVFEITEQMGAERIAIALAAGKREPDQTSYSVFDRAAVEALGIALHKTAGGTYDRAVNGVHYDVHVGNAQKLIELAGVIATGNMVPILKERVTELLRAGFESGQIDYTQNRLLCDKVKAQISK